MVTTTPLQAAVSEWRALAGSIAPLRVRHTALMSDIQRLRCDVTSLERELAQVREYRRTLMAAEAQGEKHTGEIAKLGAKLAALSANISEANERNAAVAPMIADRQAEAGAIVEQIDQASAAMRRAETPVVTEWLRQHAAEFRAALHKFALAYAKLHAAATVCEAWRTEDRENRSPVALNHAEWLNIPTPCYAPAGLPDYDASFDTTKMHTHAREALAIELAALLSE